MYLLLHVRVEYYEFINRGSKKKKKEFDLKIINH